MRRLALAGLLLLALAGAGSAQEPEAAPSAEEEIAVLDARRDALAQELAEVRRTLGSGGEQAAEQLDLLEQLDRALERQLDAHQTARSLAEDRARAQSSGAEPPEQVVQTPPPFALPVLDALRYAVESQATQIERSARLVDDLTAELELARERAADAESARRKARETADAAPSAEAERERAMRERRSRLAAAQAELAALALRNAQAEHAIQRASERRLRKAVGWVEANVSPRSDDLQQVLDRLDKREFDAHRALERARVDLQAAETRMAGMSGSASEAETAARRTELALHQRRVAVLGERLDRIEKEREAWRRRYEVRAGEPDRSALLAWRSEASQHADEIERQRRIRGSRLQELRGELASLPPAGEGDAHVRSQAAALRELIAIYERDLAELADLRQVEQRLLLDLGSATAEIPFGDWLRIFWGGLVDLWGRELTSSEDRPITVGKVAIAILIFVLGWLVARVGSRVLGRRVLPRFGFDHGASHAIELLVFYSLVVAAFLFALRSVNIPITAFAVVGGALAIGFGFGSQNVVNNFISGVILLAERPIKIGDLVEVGGVHGIIERIGLRSTRVRTGDNIHIIVPNSSFLESNVVNWTHNDQRVRVKLTVGIIYGSDTREAERLILQAIGEQAAVMESPEPVVLFMDFGDDSLVFEARFWIRMRDVMDRLRAESAIRFRIDELFRAAGIVIAFPQRDVHLDTVGHPLEVRLLERE